MALGEHRSFCEEPKGTSPVNFEILFSCFFFLCVCVFEFVVNNKAKALLAGWLFPQKNECACSALKKRSKLILK